ncbi:hypothetical protein RF11_04892 [Thelohanellus kitauei]|uniref:Uncharacterized protein n=1 Tax=Thelohanellus kitauei TaxID=669202 RepID=A0A0C2MVI1_THEKT|nr:hypothetical protein RF11_04892 [Thelohanellus kitauei]
MAVNWDKYDKEDEIKTKQMIQSRLSEWKVHFGIEKYKVTGDLIKQTGYGRLNWIIIIFVFCISQKYSTTGDTYISTASGYTNDIQLLFDGLTFCIGQDKSEQIEEIIMIAILYLKHNFVEQIPESAIILEFIELLQVRCGYLQSDFPSLHIRLTT